MKIPGLFILVGFAISLNSTIAQTENIDKEINALAEKISAQVKESGRKKVAVLEFTDLQGSSSELGRFLTEEVSVSLVERRLGFSVIDRANLAALLSEKNLTEKGLIDPKNAEEFNKASGVDAIILGKFTGLKDEVTLATKIIATDTAETVGAARARLPMSKEIEQLLSNSSPPLQPIADKGRLTIEEKTKPSAPPLIFQKFGNLIVVIESLHALDNRTILLNMIFRNTDPLKHLAVAMYAEESWNPDPPLRSSLFGSDGTEFSCSCDNLTGLRGMRQNPKNLTEIQPSNEIKTTLKFKIKNGEFSTVPPNLRIQAEIVMNANYTDSSYPANYQTQQNMLPGDCRILNLVLDIPTR